MTEPTRAFGGTAVAAPPTEVPPPSEIAGSAENRRKLLLVGAVVGVLILAAAAYFLLFKGSGSSTSGSFTVPHAQPASGTGTGTAAKGNTGPKTVTLPNVAKHPAGHNPFLPLVTPPTPAPTSAAKTSPNHNGSAPSAPIVNSQPTAPVVTVVAQWVQLDRVNGTTSAKFTVGYSDGTTKDFKVHAPKAGSETVFGTTFALLSIHHGYVTITYGDGTPFDVHQGAKNRQAI